MKKILTILTIAFFTTLGFGQVPDSTYAQWVDGDWVVEVNPNNHPILKNRDSGPTKAYNRLTGEYFIWQPCGLWKDASKPLFEKGADGIVRHNGCLELYDVAEELTISLPTDLSYFGYLSGEGVIEIDDPIVSTTFNSSNPDSVIIIIKDTLGNIEKYFGYDLTLIGDYVSITINAGEPLPTIESEIKEITLTSYYIYQKTRPIDSVTIEGKSYVVVNENTLRTLNPDSVDFSTLVTTHVKDMSSLFENNSTFNQDIGGWDVSNVTDMSFMFYVAEAFNQDIGGWDVSNVTNMNSMFFVAEAFNHDIGSWEVSNVTDMGFMFLGTDLNQDIGGWDVSSVTDMNAMFRGSSFNQDISSWDVSTVTNMNSMFRDADSFNQDLSNWCVPLILSEPGFFDNNASSWVLPKPIWGTCP